MSGDMELLRRALLVGCLLPALWLMRLTPLDPLVTVVAVDFAAQQRREAAAVPDDRKTEAERRRALIALPVYIEEFLQYNVFSATGATWGRLLRGVDAMAQGREAGRDLRWRASVDRSEDSAVPFLFFQPDEEPIRNVLDQLSAGHGTTYVSISRPGGDSHYRVERRIWTREDFRPGPGFTGRPAPPTPLLYPFRSIGAGLATAGVLLFALLPGTRRTQSWLGISGTEAGIFVVALVLFGAPLLIVGGAVQTLSRGLAIALPCWIVSAVGIHLFARPGRHATDVLSVASGAAAGGVNILFRREGLAFLSLAIGPLAFLATASVILWNR